MAHQSINCYELRNTLKTVLKPKTPISAVPSLDNDVQLARRNVHNTFLYSLRVYYITQVTTP